MLRRLPLFPLGRVLFPGAMLALHVFEDRYRRLVQDLLDRPEQDRELGIVAIRSGAEVGAQAVPDLYEVGCVTHVLRATELADGRFDLATVGRSRFRLIGVRTDLPYLVGDVELLPDDGAADPADHALGATVRRAFTDYVHTLREAGVDTKDIQVPTELGPMGYVIADTVLLDLADRQALLAAGDGRARLRSELGLMRRESLLLRALGAVPAPALARTPVSPN